MTDLPSRISLREVGPRDGLQNEDPVPTAAKIELINALSGTGVSRIEAVSFVRAGGDPADGRRRPGVAGHRAGARGSATRRWPPTCAAPGGRWMPGSPRSRRWCRPRTRTTGGTSTGAREESLDDIAVMIERGARPGRHLPGGGGHRVGLPLRGGRAGEPGARGGGPGGGRRGGRHLVRRHHRHGHAAPGHPSWSASSAPRTRTSPLNLHFHNTRGTGLANVLAALELGVDDFDASVGGLGGCPYAPGASGNIATEELVHMVEDMGVATGVDLEAMIERGGRGGTDHRAPAAVPGAAGRPAHPDDRSLTKPGRRPGRAGTASPGCPSGAA